MEQFAEKKCVVWHDTKFVWTYDINGKEYRIRGRTIAVIWAGDIRQVGIAYCSARDPFDRAKGRLIAEGRARMAPARPHYHAREIGKPSTAFTFPITNDLLATAESIPEWMYREKSR